MRYQPIAAGVAVSFLCSSPRRSVKALVTSINGAYVGKSLSSRSNSSRTTHKGFVGSLNATGGVTASNTATTGVAERIYQLVGRDFDIGKPSALAKVLFDEVKLADPKASEQGAELQANSAKAGARRSRSVSVATLSSVLKAEEDPRKRELVRLVLEWLEAQAVSKRGGFIATGSKVADMPEWASRLIPDHDELPADPSALPVVLIDGNYLIHRSYHGMPPLSAPDGTPVGALVGFCNAINRLVVKPWVDGSEPRRKVVIAFDTGRQNFRHAIYAGYKANRAETPQDLRPQFGLIRKACEAYGLEAVEGDGYEADDVIASLALEAVTAGATDVTIVSGDKDLAQLVTRRVNMLNFYTGEALGPEEVLSKFLVPPGRLADFLAIAGDSSDGIRGADGYGPVKAAKVLAKHGTLEEAVEEICLTMSKKNNDPELSEQTRAQVLLARRLVELCTDVPLAKRSGPKNLDVEPFELPAGDRARRLLGFMRDAAIPDLARRTANILGVDENGSSTMR